MRKFSFLAIFCSTLFTDLSAVPSWETDTVTLGTSSGANTNVNISQGPNSGEAVSVWADSNTYAPYYSIFHEGVWTTGSIPLTVTTGVYNNIFISNGPQSGQLVATWSDYGSEEPYYSFYNGSTWATSFIPLGGSNGAYNDVTVAPGPNNSEVVATWKNVGGAGEPYYSIYSGGSWTTAIIPSGTSNGAANNVFISTGPISGTLVAAWADRFTFQPYYSLYNGTSWTTSTIPLGTSSGVFNDIVVIKGPGSNELVATWVDTATQAPYYSIYSGGSWSPGALIPNGGLVASSYDVFVSVGPSSGSLVATWKDSVSSAAYYSTYSNGAWSTGEALPLGTSTAVRNDVGIAKTLNGSQMIATWPDSSYPGPVYYSSLSSPLPNPPESGSGLHVKDRFALVTEWFNELTWVSSSSEGVVSYNIRRNGSLIATVQGLSFTDYNRSKKGLDTYTITSVNAQGEESSTALTITIG